MVGEHRLVALVDRAEGDDLVARRSGEGGERALELLVDLGGEVLVEQVEAALAEFGTGIVMRRSSCQGAEPTNLCVDATTRPHRLHTVSGAGGDEPVVVVAEELDVGESRVDER